MSAWVVALQTGPEAPLGDPGLGTARALLALVAVTGALLLFLWLLKRGTFAVAGRGARQALAVESALPLGERRSLVVVRVEGRRLLLGMSPTHVSLVTELAPTPATFDHALESAGREEGRHS
jgi:flagellar protein FliO/FliZ